LSISRGRKVLNSIETLRRAARIIEALCTGHKPGARMLADAPLADCWAIIPGKDLYRIGGVLTPPGTSAQLRIVPLLAIDEDAEWALVFVDDQARWWHLGESLPGRSEAGDPTEIIRLAEAWIRHRLQDS
jgi:hypothetical protein